MNRSIPLVLATLAPLALAVAACAVAPLPDAARTINPLALGSNQDPETAAINAASYSLADPARTRGDPLSAARALASVDYLAGDLYANPRWNGMNPVWKQQMLDARAEIRAVMGIAPGAGSQQVVDAFLATANSMAAKDSRAMQAALASPLFTFGADRTFALLQNLPPLPVANVASAHVEQSAFGADRNCIECG